MGKPSPLAARALLMMAHEHRRLKVVEKSYRAYEQFDVDWEPWTNRPKLKWANVNRMLAEKWIASDSPDSEEYGHNVRFYSITGAGVATVDGKTSEDFQPKPPYFTAEEIKGILKGYHAESGWWLFVTEMEVDGRRIDGFAVGYATGNMGGWGSIAYEVKISRSDLMADIANPDKRKPFLKTANEFYYVTTRGLAHHLEIPKECGLIEVWKNKSVHVVVDAPRTASIPSWELVGRFARRGILGYRRHFDFRLGEWIGEDQKLGEMINEV